MRVLGLHEASLKAYEKAREANPFDPAVESDAGLALSGAGRAQEALEAYRFNDLSRVIYEFVWHEYCDWFLEILKIRLREGLEPEAAKASSHNSCRRHER